MGALLLIQSLFGIWADPSSIALAWGLSATGVVLCVWAACSRRPALAMVALPVLALVALASASEAARAAFAHPVRWTAWGASLIGVISCFSAAEARSAPDAVSREPRDRTAWRARSLGVAAGAPLLLLSGSAALVLQEPDAHATLAEVALLAHAVLVFLWSIAVYVFFVVPLANASRDRAREQSAAARWHLPAARRRRRIEGLLWLVLFGAIALALRYG